MYGCEKTGYPPLFFAAFHYLRVAKRSEKVSRCYSLFIFDNIIFDNIIFDNNEIL